MEKSILSSRTVNLCCGAMMAVGEKVIFGWSPPNFLPLASTLPPPSIRLSVFDATVRCSLPPGGGEAVRPGRPDVRRMPGGALRGQVCPVLLRQRHLPAVLLRVLLGQHPLTSRPRVSQAAGEGGRGPPSPRVLPLELRRGAGGGVVGQPLTPVSTHTEPHFLHLASRKRYIFYTL